MEAVRQLADADISCEAPLDFGSVTILVIISCILGLVWAAYNFVLVRKIDVEKGNDGT
jgi:hypothetical protein